MKKATMVLSVLVLVLFVFNVAVHATTTSTGPVIVSGGVMVAVGEAAVSVWNFCASVTNSIFGGQ